MVKQGLQKYDLKKGPPRGLGPLTLMVVLGMTTIANRKNFVHVFYFLTWDKKGV